GPRRARPVWARLRAYPSIVGIARPADELPSVPPWTLALDAQRRHPRLSAREAGARPRRRPGALPPDSGLDGLRSVLLPRAHAGARGRSAAGGRASRRAHRAGRAGPRCRAPDPDDRRDDRRLAHLGLPLLERRALADALLLDARGHPA